MRVTIESNWSKQRRRSGKSASRESWSKQLKWTLKVSIVHGRGARSTRTGQSGAAGVILLVALLVASVFLNAVQISVASIAIGAPALLGRTRRRPGGSTTHRSRIGRAEFEDLQ